MPYILDKDEKTQNIVKKFVLDMIKDIQPDVDERIGVYTIRRDMFEGRHHKYSNVMGLLQKEQEGHVLPVFNYIKKFSKKLTQSVTNFGFRLAVVAEDESNDIESVRSENVEQFIEKVLYDNKFYRVIFKRGTMTQVRDGDTAIKCVVEENNAGGRDIRMYLCERPENLYVLWDDTQGTSFSALAYVDEWSNERIRREFPGVKLDDNKKGISTNTVGSHDNNQYATMGILPSNKNMSPSGKSKIPTERVIDFWGWIATDKDERGYPIYKVTNMVLVGKGEEAQIVQYMETDYNRIPWVFVHGESNPGKPWSSSFNDILFDANIELNDRTGEEADVIRIGANRKFVVKNMSDFDADSVKAGSGQVIYIDGEDADFYPLPDSVNIFPSESYKNSMLEHLFSLGLPKIALSAGTAPYTGRVGAIQYQAVTDEVTDLRDNWTNALEDLFLMIQEYGITFFPDLKEIFTISEEIEPGVFEDTVTAPRRVTIDWDNPLPLSRSDQVIDGATLFDRRVLPIKEFLTLAGYKDPNRIIKILKKEWSDPELVPIRSTMQELSTGVLIKQNEAARMAAETNEQIEMQANMAANPPQTNTPAPMRHSFQNSNQRGVSSAKGVPQTGGSATPEGAARQVQQNVNAQSGA